MVEDGIASNAPHIEHLEANKLKYLLGAKPIDHKFLFETLANSEESQYHEMRDEEGTLHQFYFLNNTALNKSHPNVKVNVWEYRQTTSKGKELNMSWVTNIRMTKENAYQIMRGGRARWKIENETFNTLKNLGYNFEHNYGHGKQFLSSNLCLLMMLAFLIDQIMEIACKYYRDAKAKAGTYRTLWEKMRTLFDYVILGSWEALFLMIAKKTPLDTC
jgi:Transposase DDE domain